MKETIEHNNRFYGEELKTESEQYKEWLVIANKEIERLGKENTILKQTMCNNSLLINENALLNSIIKEVREYIKENMSYIEKGKLEYIPSGEELLEIIDKVEESKC